ncbi:MAG: metallophosphoesterase [Clostridia bacterium]
MFYVMSDIHGAYNSFINMLELINFTEDDELYILGDVIDRNYGGIKILNYIKNSNNIHLLSGNHEQLFVTYLTEEDETMSKILLEDWIAVGGKVTIEELKEYTLDEVYNLLEWIDNLPYYIVIGEYVLVHGGFEMPHAVVTLEEVLNYNSKYDMIWNRTFFLDNNYRINNYTVILGHTTTLSVNSKADIIYKKGKINIDCGSGFNGIGRLSCLCLDTMQEFYI